MKDYFLQLFEYDRYCNRLILQTIFEANEPGKSVILIAHLLAAQQIWLNRCKGFENANDAPFWPDWNTAVFEEAINSNYTNWTAFIKNEELQKRIAYKNSKGAAFENTLSEIITHVINHGTHHRAQAGQHLKLAGIETLPLTDYIAWVRNR